MTNSVAISHRYLICSIATVSLVGNLLLIYLIINHTKSNIGRYRYLMIIFAAFDIVYASAQALVSPEFHMQEHTFLIVYDGFFVDILSRHIQSHLAMMYCGFFCQSLVILAYHFLYRYIVICEPDLMLIFEKGRYVFLMISVYCLIPTIWNIACEFFLPMTAEKDENVHNSFMEMYNTSLYERGYWGPLFRDPVTNELNPKDFIGFCMLVSIKSVALLVVLIAAYKTYHKLNTVKMSTTTRLLQRKLFKVLLVQTLVPIFTVYLPGFTLLIGPLTGWNFRINLGYVITVMVSLFPATDPLVIMYFLTDYRNAITRAFTGTKVSSSSGSIATGSSQLWRSSSKPFAFSSIHRQLSQ